MFEYCPGMSDETIDLSKGEKHDVYIPINIHLDFDMYEGDMLMPTDDPKITKLPGG